MELLMTIMAWIGIIVSVIILILLIITTIVVLRIYKDFKKTSKLRQELYKASDEKEREEVKAKLDNIKNMRKKPCCNDKKFKDDKQ